MTGDVRVAIEVTVRKLPVPADHGVDHSAREESGGNNPHGFRNAIVSRETFVHEGVIGVEYGENISIFPNNALEEQFCFASKSLSKIVIEFLGVWSCRRQVSQIKPLPAEIVDEARDFGSFNMRRTC
jgi:hypothetical protein